MTKEEAIEFTEINVSNYCNECLCTDVNKCAKCARTEWKRLVVDALEKQTPKKPKETDAYPHRLYCPCCSWTLCYNKENADGFRMMNMFLYCPECGQAIDWSDNE